jgi:hypothetical protein
VSASCSTTRSAPIEISSRSSIQQILAVDRGEDLFRNLQRRTPVADAVMDRRAAALVRNRSGLIVEPQFEEHAELALAAPHGTARELVPHHQSAANK